MPPTIQPRNGLRERLIEACGLEESPRHLIRDREQVYGERFSRQVQAFGIREADCAAVALAKRVCRARDWIDSTGMPML